MWRGTYIIRISRRASQGHMESERTEFDRNFKNDAPVSLVKFICFGVILVSLQSHMTNAVVDE